MSIALQGRMAIRARQVKPGEAYAVEVKAGQFIQITDVTGKQVADFVAFNLENRGEHLSVAATRTVGSTIMLQLGMELVSNRRNTMFELVEDTVGRHDILLSLCGESAIDDTPDPAATTKESGPESAVAAPETQDETAPAEPEPDPEAIAATDTSTEPSAGADTDAEPEPEAIADPPATSSDPEPAPVAGCLTALSRALEPFGIAADQVPDPINWFMNVGIKGRGEIEIREPLSERNDYVVLAARMDAVIAVTACSQADGPTNGNNPTDILIRVFR